MTSKERFRKTFRHEEPDRVPFCEFFFSQRVRRKVLGKEETDKAKELRKVVQLVRTGQWQSRFEQIVLEDVQEQIELCRKLGYDMLRVRPNLPQNIPSICTYLTLPADVGFIRPNPPGDVSSLPEEVSENIWREEDKYGFWSTLFKKSLS